MIFDRWSIGIVSLQCDFDYVSLKCKIYKTFFHSRSIGMTFLHGEFVYALLNEHVEKMPSNRGSNGKGFLLYECKCSLTSLADLNIFGQRKQWNGCSSLWIILCIFKFPNWENTFWQKEHWNGFSPLRDRLWIINWEEKVNSFWHKTQMCTLPSFFIFFELI